MKIIIRFLIFLRKIINLNKDKLVLLIENNYLTKVTEFFFFH